MALTITPPPALCAARNPIVWLAQASAGWEALEGYRVRIDIQAESAYRSGTWETVDTLHEIPDAEGEAVFLLDQVIEGLLLPELPPWPADASTAVCTRLAGRFRVIAYEFWGGAQQSSATGTPFHVLRAGFDAYTGQGLTDWAITQKRILSHQPRRKRVSAVQPDWIYWVAPAAGTYSLRGTLTYDDATTLPVFAPAISQAAEQYDVLRFPAGYAQLGLGSQPKAVQSWELWIVNAAGAEVSERVRWRIHPDYADWLSRYFLFEGALGGWHSVQCAGESEHRAEPQSVAMQRVLRHDAAASEAELAHAQSRFTRNAVQYSGYLDAATASWLEDLVLLSEHVYRTGNWTPNRTGAGSLVPVRIRRESLLLRRDNDFLYAVQFTYDEARTHRGL